MKIGIYIYEQAEVLDFSGPFEVFAKANMLTDEYHFEPLLISEAGGLVYARAGYQVMSSHSIDNHPALDVLIVVGGVHTEEMHNQPVLDWLSLQDEKVPVVASVCTGAFILAAAKVLTSESVTTHWEDIPDLRQQFPSLTVIENRRWVESGKFTTSAGISAGIDMSLRLVERLASHELAIKTARQMEFDIHPVERT
ncbi:DJ-1/PfpI family protein [Thalassotalea euphylliae]|uniref:DJ-1/PfpI family protein n=1 Tax=Thalassotalea euphylliae TaxID=1655234 RepID=UPI003624B1D6